MHRLFIVLFAAFIAGASPAFGQEREVPYWATIDTSELNMRVGPSVNYRIEWVYRREGLPVKVVRVIDGWRLIRDPDGAQGWVVARLLSARRGAIVVGEGLAALREAPADNAQLKWNAEPGVVGKLGECEAGWCRFDVAGRAGWIRAERLWGAGEP
ncbi:SH3 domain-containing protein [Pelagerythrobacter marinus]|jgi:SH3-like domain-containing protein|uniref:SH3 domain-containing protein n=1 Tax=Pelagerythrobacter marinus TaxID=538382 RepID=UPI002036D574|nr:SH3 domain-containing protein [Pelagerythrobacter marinus]MEC9066997.1 SH3 domain-containing protein [Pseudomonadota bacterium]USA38305.1 SH3 domain-containing protein [Pelagerythrobacter marinus]WPZ07733.1 SH3 domain-containing protein [Pelagerythrobacter marinus]